MDSGSAAVVDVLVVGAGPTGLTLAAQLRAFDLRVRIIDRLLDRTHESRALAVQPRTLELLRGLGVFEVRQEMSRWDVENPRAASSPE